LDGQVEFSNGGRQNFVLLDEFSFKNCQVGDEIEIDGNSMEVREARKYSKNLLPEDMDLDGGSQLDEEENNDGKLGLVSEQKQLSAYKKQTVHELFRISLEWLEKYIEVAYPNYKTRKQIHDNNIKRQDANDPSKIENMFAGSLFGFKSILEATGKPQFLCDEVKQEYYKCLDAKGVDVNNCPPRLGHFLFEINEILEGRGEKFERDAANRKNDIDSNSVEYQKAVNEVFTYIQSPLEDARNEHERLKGKSHKDIEFKNNFGSSGKRAEQVFRQMAGKHDYKDFYFFPQRERNPNYSALRDDPSEEFLGSSSSIGSSSVARPSNPRLNISHLTGQELKDNYLQINNYGQLSREQLGEIQQAENELILNQNIDVPLNMAVSVANGGLAFVLTSAGGVL